jgi:hypothetical protein
LQSLKIGTYAKIKAAPVAGCDAFNRGELFDSNRRVSSRTACARCGTSRLGVRRVGQRVMVDVDLAPFFDRVNHDILMQR